MAARAAPSGTPLPSHGLAQHRLDGVRLTAAGFTNITRDHLDYHATFEDYLAAKLRLFADVLPDGAAAVIDADGTVTYTQQVPEIADEPDYDAALAALRARLAGTLRVPVAVAYGPRYLHSTGQLHKGGPPGGAFLILTNDPAHRLHIPGEPFGFTELLHAQAVGDYRALRGRGRRAGRAGRRGRPTAPPRPSSRRSCGCRSRP